MKIDEEKFPWNIMAKIIEAYGREYDDLYEKGEKQMEVLVNTANMAARIVANKHKCPKCGSSNIETYNADDGQRNILRCEACKSIMTSKELSLDPKMIQKLQYKMEHPLLSQLPIIMWLMAFSASFALITRYLTSAWGL